jgi:NDP-sugar pyrophosphorylase family protein
MQDVIAIVRDQCSIINDYVDFETGLVPLLKSLPELADQIGRDLGIPLEKADFCVIDGPVWIGRNVTISPFSTLRGPIFIGDNCFIGSNALLRPGTIICQNAVIGFSCELKECVVMEGARISHNVFVGNSIIGKNTNIGRGFTTSNFKNANDFEKNPATIKISTQDEKIDTGLLHLGLIAGEDCRFGCHNVSYPGTVIEKGVHTYPNASLRGYITKNQIVKTIAQNQFIERIS